MHYGPIAPKPPTGRTQNLPHSDDPGFREEPVEGARRGSGETPYRTKAQAKGLLHNSVAFPAAAQQPTGQPSHNQTSSAGVP